MMMKDREKKIFINKSQIKRLKDSGVSLVYIFGSYAEGKSLPLSDVDIGFVFTDTIKLKENIGEIYSALYDIITDVFPGKDIDIVFLQRASLELRFDVISHGKLLYESTREERLDFEEKTALFYADFKPILNEINQVILDRA